MNDIETALHEHYTAWSDDLGAEQRITAMLTSCATSRGAGRRPRHLPAMAAGIAIMVGMVASTLLWLTPGTRHTTRPLSSTSVDGRYQDVTAQSAVQELMSSLPVSGSVTGLGGEVIPGCVGGHLDFTRSGRLSHFEVTIGVPSDGAPSQRCGLPRHNAPDTRFISEPGARIAVTTSQSVNRITFSVFLLRSDQIFVAVRETTSRADPELSLGRLLAVVRGPQWQARVPRELAERSAKLFVPIRLS